MKKAMMAVMAAAMMATGATALAAPNDHGDCRGNVPCVEASYAHCGDGYCDGHRGRGYYRHGRGYHGRGCGWYRYGDGNDEG